MLDATPARITRHGTIVIDQRGVAVIGFEGENTSCRDLAVLALTWAIGELQRELLADLQAPGGSLRVHVD